MGQRALGLGQRIYFGVPDNPMAENLADAIGDAIELVPGILEAYLPQCYIVGDKGSRQVLVVSVDAADSIPEIVQALMKKINGILPEGECIDIVPFPSSSMPSEARIAQCRIA